LAALAVAVALPLTLSLRATVVGLLVGLPRPLASGRARVDDAEDEAAFVRLPEEADTGAAVAGRTGDEGIDVAPPATGVLRNAKISSSLLGLVAGRDCACMRPLALVPGARPPAPSVAFLTEPTGEEDPSSSPSAHCDRGARD
jgi:hypothetical protein